MKSKEFSNINVGEQLCAMRIAKDLTRKQFAALSAIPVDSLFIMECKTTDMKLSNFIKYANGLDIQPHKLLQTLQQLDNQ